MPTPWVTKAGEQRASTQKRVSKFSGRGTFVSKRRYFLTGIPRAAAIVLALTPAAFRAKRVRSGTPITGGKMQFPYSIQQG
jgi:hypothetical protein